MQFDINLAANGSQHLDVSGSFLKYKSGTGPIRVRLNGGGYIDLVPGQGVRNVQFNNVDVKDRSGAANTGIILAGAYDFEDDNVTIGGGSINVGNTTAQRVPVTLDLAQFVTTTPAYASYNWESAAALAAPVQIADPATNAHGLIVLSLQAVASQTAGYDTVFYFGINSADVRTLLYVAGGGALQTVQNAAQYLIPQGFGLYVKTTNAALASFKSALWCLK